MEFTCTMEYSEETRKALEKLIGDGCFSIYDKDGTTELIKLVRLPGCSTERYKEVVELLIKAFNQ